MPLRNDDGQRGDQHGAGQRGADRRAEVRHRVLHAADLAALLVGHRRDGDAARVARPARRRPSPASSIGQVTISGPAPASSAAIRTTMPANSARNPSCTTRRGDACGNTFGNADRRQQQRDRQRQQPDTGRDGREPERDRQEQRHDEEQPGLQEVLEEERREPAPQRRVPQHRRVDERGVAPRRVRRFSHDRKSHSTSPPAEDQPDHRRQPEPLRGARPWAGRIPTFPSAGCRTRSGRARARTARCRPGRAARPSPAGRVGHPPGEHAGSTSTTRTSPANTHRHDAVGGEQAADQRPGRDRDRAGRGDQAVRARPLVAARSWTRPARRSRA